MDCLNCWVGRKDTAIPTEGAGRSIGHLIQVDTDAPLLQEALKSVESQDSDRFH